MTAAAVASALQTQQTPFDECNVSVVILPPSKKSQGAILVICNFFFALIAHSLSLIPCSVMT